MKSTPDHVCKVRQIITWTWKTRWWKLRWKFEEHWWPQCWIRTRGQINKILQLVILHLQKGNVFTWRRLWCRLIAFYKILYVEPTVSRQKDKSAFPYIFSRNYSEMPISKCLKSKLCQNLNARQFRIQHWIKQTQSLKSKIVIWNP